MKHYISVFTFPPLKFIPVEKRKDFAISIISDCNAGSLRDQYQNALISYLGKDKVDRFGKCGDKTLPGNLLNFAATLIAKYKFYFSFENTIQDGYVTEKLFFTLNIPTLPVYYGCLNVPNITTVPSFIKASDFPTPKALADYLLYLDAHPEEYMQYHRWRWDPSLFDEEYLHRLTYGVAGPDEQTAHAHDGHSPSRTSQFCRLCNENFVKKQTEERDLSKSIVNKHMSKDEIYKRFFGKSRRRL